MSKRKRQRRADRRARREAAQQQAPEMQPGDVIKPLADVPTDADVDLWCRASRGEQDGSNRDQKADLRQAVESRPVVTVHTYTGRALDALPALREAAAVAAERGAWLVAECTSRFVRHPSYHPGDTVRREFGPRPEDLEALVELIEETGVRLATYCKPDATQDEEREHQRRRGVRQNGRTGGRPPKPQPGARKQKREAALPKVRWMKWVGMSNRAIGRALDTDEKNVRRWGAAYPRYEPPEVGV